MSCYDVQARARRQPRASLSRRCASRRLISARSRGFAHGVRSRRDLMFDLGAISWVCPRGSISARSRVRSRCDLVFDLGAISSSISVRSRLRSRRDLVSLCQVEALLVESGELQLNAPEIEQVIRRFIPSHSANSSWSFGDLSLFIRRIQSFGDLSLFIRRIPHSHSAICDHRRV